MSAHCAVTSVTTVADTEPHVLRVSGDLDLDGVASVRAALLGALGPAGLTERRTAFSAPELVMAWAQAHAQGIEHGIPLGIGLLHIREGAVLELFVVDGHGGDSCAGCTFKGQCSLEGKRSRKGNAAARALRAAPGGRRG